MLTDGAIAVLRGLPLTALSLGATPRKKYNPPTDAALGALKGMPLTSLSLRLEFWVGFCRFGGGLSGVVGFPGIAVIGMTGLTGGLGFEFRISVGFSVGLGGFLLGLEASCRGWRGWGGVVGFLRSSLQF